MGTGEETGGVDDFPEEEETTKEIILELAEARKRLDSACKKE